jgi:hypothetical protein
MTATDLSGRTAIITGASRGIGLAIAQRLAADGANVVLTARKQESADAAAEQVGGSAIGVAAHAVDEDAAKHCVDLTLDRFGSIDILVNNAGTNPAFGPLIEQDHARPKHRWPNTAAPWSTPHPSEACTKLRRWGCTTPPRRR